MESWTPKHPTDSNLKDREVVLESQNLLGKKIAFLVSGGIAAYKAPLVIRELRRHGAQVIVYTSTDALRFVAKDALEWASLNPVVTELSARAEHLEDESPFSAYLVAPATYNIINKMRYGVADSALSVTLAAAIGRLEKNESAVLLSPSMNGRLYNSIVHESLNFLRDKGVLLIPPRDEGGKHNQPDEKTIAAYVCAAISQSRLKNKKVLVTGGPTSTRIDSVRRLTNKFTGKLAIEIAKELSFRGANVQLVLGKGSLESPSFLRAKVVSDYDEYKDFVLSYVKDERPEIGVFSAAVADYKPREYFPGKIPSGTMRAIELVGTEKVIDLAREISPEMKMVSFKYQENMTHEELIRIGHARLARGHAAVVVNRGEEVTDSGEQVAHLLTAKTEARLSTKKGIACGIVDFLECESAVRS